MPEIESTYQHARSSTELRSIVTGKLPEILITELQAAYGGSRAGVLLYEKAGAHISEPLSRATFLAERTQLDQIVVFNQSYFAISSKGVCSGPLAELCKPDATTAKNWADTALKMGDVETLIAANALLPERPANVLTVSQADFDSKPLSEEFWSQYGTKVGHVKYNGPPDIVSNPNILVDVAPLAEVYDPGIEIVVKSPGFGDRRYKTDEFSWIREQSPKAALLAIARNDDIQSLRERRS